jgi:hypothetical protein
MVSSTGREALSARLLRVLQFLDFWSEKRDPPVNLQQHKRPTSFVFGGLIYLPDLSKGVMS